TEAEFAVLGFPPFFTPNGDGYNDLWRPKGLEATVQLRIAIFDRYGKLLKEFNPHATGWDGTLNGAYLPNDDYWFLATFEDGTEYRGHFALKR
ncbi:MAG: T9SS type B sorting domain-containing protein, partial [Mangrovimonas sp.]|nr:T9SS type B sorting domain-containing protein [Mangrovimonas sp.]